MAKRSRPAKTLRISEIYYSIQGESTWMGYPCIFIRLTGCHLRCVYCDSAHAFYAGMTMTIPDILRAIARYPCRLVEITGGEPLLQKNVIPLMETLLERGYRVLLETSGACSIAAVPPRVVKIVDVKCPDSGECPSFYFPNFRWLMPWDQLKFVIRTWRDFYWAVDFVRTMDLVARWEILFSPAHGEFSAKSLARAILRTGLPIRLQIQLHKYIHLDEGMDPAVYAQWTRHTSAPAASPRGAYPARQGDSCSTAE